MMFTQVRALLMEVKPYVLSRELIYHEIREAKP